jgi:hypothetical protein
MMRFKQRCKADTNVMRRVWVELVSSFFVYFREIGPSVSYEKMGRGGDKHCWDKD